MEELNFFSNLNNISSQHIKTLKAKCVTTEASKAGIKDYFKIMVKPGNITASWSFTLSLDRS